MSKLQVIKDSIATYTRRLNLSASVKLLAVTKNQTIQTIESLLLEGHKLFGENRIQEAQQKWSVLLPKYPEVDLHFIGHLQTNKIKEAVRLFNVIETLDSIKHAEKLVAEQEKQNKSLMYYIEINIGKENQKSGVWPEDFPEFYDRLTKYFPLNIKGIMCIPPVNKDPIPYFKEMKNIAEHYHLPVISMGMSDDYPQAIEAGSTLVRIGSALFKEA